MTTDGMCKGENVIADGGAVEIRQVPACILALTSVKGGMDVARETAQFRLRRYVSGDNRSGITLNAQRPVLQQKEAPELWQIAVRLCLTGDISTAPVPRDDNVRIVGQQSATWAVISKSGRPTEWSVAWAEMAICDALARTHWFAMGSPIVCIHPPRFVLPLTGRFEVAVPVVLQSAEDPCRLVPTLGNRRADRPGLPVH